MRCLIISRQTWSYPDIPIRARFYACSVEQEHVEQALVALSTGCFIPFPHTGGRVCYTVGYAVRATRHRRQEEIQYT